MNERGKKMREHLKDANVRAFLKVVRACEGTAGVNGYRTMFGGKLFDGFEDHPRKTIVKKSKTARYVTTAAGAYQFLERTWDDMAGRYDLHDFRPETQDVAAVALISRRGGLEAVKKGFLEQALAKCAFEWASLPGSPYGQPTKQYSYCEMVFLKEGGALA